MAVRFQADADLSQIIVAAVLRRSPEIDFRTAHAGGLGGLNDLEVLEVAAREFVGSIEGPRDLSSDKRRLAGYGR